MARMIRMTRMNRMAHTVARMARWLADLADPVKNVSENNFLTEISSNSTLVFFQKYPMIRARLQNTGPPLTIHQTSRLVLFVCSFVLHCRDKRASKNMHLQKYPLYCVAAPRLILILSHSIKAPTKLKKLKKVSVKTPLKSSITKSPNGTSGQIEVYFIVYSPC